MCLRKMNIGRGVDSGLWGYESFSGAVELWLHSSEFNGFIEAIYGNQVNFS